MKVLTNNLTIETPSVERVNELATAMQAGGEYANGLKVGDVFRGSYGEGRMRYPNDDDMAEFFGAGAHAVIRCMGIWSTDDGTITRLKKSPSRST